jgi:hypothetical protein
MAMMTRNNLVLRSVTVREAGLTVETRRGLGYHGVAEPLAPISMRSPQDANPIPNPDQRRFREQEQLADTAAKRAGRSACQVGSPHRHSSPSRLSRVLKRSWPWSKQTPGRSSASQPTARGLESRRFGLARTAG